MMIQLTDKQWADLLRAIAQVPILDALLQCKARDLLDLADLMDKAFASSINQPWHLTDGDRAGLLAFAQMFRIDPQTAQPIPHIGDDEPTNAGEGEVVYVDEFIAQLCGERI